MITNEQKALYVKTYGKDLRPDILELHYENCTRLGAPLLSNLIVARQQLNKRDGTYSYIGITTIAYMKQQAQLTKEYLGFDKPTHHGTLGEKGSWTEQWMYRLVQGQKAQFYAEAHWDEYCPTGNAAFFWNSMPYIMLPKVCKAALFREAFADVISGLYIREEFEKHDSTEQTYSDVMVQDFPPNTALTGRLLALSQGTGGDPGKATIEMAGIPPMQFDLLGECQQWVALVGSEVTFQYKKQKGGYKVITTMEAASQNVELRGTPEGAKLDELTADPQHTASPTEAGPLPPWGSTSDQWAAPPDPPIQEHGPTFAPNQEFDGMVEAVTQIETKSGKRPWELEIWVGTEEKVAVTAWKNANEFDPGLASFDEVIGKEVIFVASQPEDRKTGKGRIFNDRPVYWLETFILNPVPSGVQS